MSDILISLMMVAVFVAIWAFMLKVGGLDWMVDARMAAARRMLSDSKFAFDGEVHTPVPAAAVPASAPLASPLAAQLASASGWIPKAFVPA